MAWLPNALSLLRLAVALPIAVLILAGSQPAFVVALAIFVVAALTDLADGALARRWHAQTVLGSHLDPLADKALVIAALGALAATGRLGALALVAFAIILIREFVVGVVRIRRARQGVALDAAPTAKLKTFAQFAAVAILIAGLAFPGMAALVPLGDWGLAAAALLSFVSAWPYVRAKRR
jgi:cardiolipin synthase